MQRNLTQGQTSHYKIYEQRYSRSRGNLLAVVIFTVINIILLVTNAGSYFLFSASIPYYIATLAMTLCGRFPDEYYGGLKDSMAFFSDTVFIVLMVIAVAITLLYFVAWLMSSKNRGGWLIFALVLFIIDTLGLLLLNGLAIEGIMDIVFHGLVIGYLILGVSAHSKLKKLPAKDTVVSVTEGEPQGEVSADGISDPVIEEAKTSPILRRAEDVKHRVLLQTKVLDYDVCYRRVKHTNELVINGNVYDEYTKIVEGIHVLKAWVGGQYIEAGTDGYSSFISLNGNVVESKRRLY